MIIKRFLTLLAFVILFGCYSGINAQINTDRVLMMGRSAIAYEDYVLAISYFNKVIRVKPYLPEPYFFRAYAKYSLDDLKGAEMDMNKAIEISPFHADFFNFRGTIKSRSEKHIEALKDFDEVLKLEPVNSNAYFNKGLAHMSLKEYNNAIDDYTEVLKIEPSQYGAYINRAIAKLNIKDTIGALTDMNEAIEVNPLVADAHKFSAYIYYEINKFDQALERINEAIRLNEKEASYYVLRGVIRYQQDNLRGTMNDFDKVIELQPKNVLAYANRGILRVEVGDVNNAIDDFSRVLALNPNDLLTLYNRALLLLRVGELQKAISDLNLIIANYPNYGDAYMARSQAYQGLNKSLEAQKDYNMAYKLEQDSRKKAEEQAKTENSNNKKPKETRSQSDDDIRNHDKIAVLDDFGIDEPEAEELDNLRGKIQNKNIVIDLETVYGLTFFSVDSMLNRTRYFKQEVTQFNQAKKIGRPLVFSNRELENTDAQALEYFNTIERVSSQLTQDPSNYIDRFVRAILFTVVQNYSSAINDYDYIIKNQDINNKYSHFAYLNRAYVRYKMVELMQAFEEEELPLNMGNPLVKNNTFDLNKKIDDEPVIQKVLDYRLIENDLLKVVEIKPDFEFAYYNLGILNCLQKNYEEAINNFSRAIELNPFFAEAYFNRGLTKIFLKQEDEGTIDLSKAGELGLYKAYNVMKRYGASGEEDKEEETDN